MKKYNIEIDLDDALIPHTNEEGYTVKDTVDLFSQFVHRGICDSVGVKELPLGIFDDCKVESFDLRTWSDDEGRFYFEVTTTNEQEKIIADQKTIEAEEQRLRAIKRKRNAEISKYEKEIIEQEKQFDRKFKLVTDYQEYFNNEFLDEISTLFDTLKVIHKKNKDRFTEIKNLPPSEEKTILLSHYSIKCSKIKECGDKLRGAYQFGVEITTFDLSKDEEVLEAYELQSQANPDHSASYYLNATVTNSYKLIDADKELKDATGS